MGMKGFIKVLCAAMAAVTIAAGCSGASRESPDAEEKTGQIASRYVETEITPPELSAKSADFFIDSKGVFPHPDGSVDFIAALFSRGDDKIKPVIVHYASPDGGQTWESKDLGWLNAELQTYGGESGGLYALQVDSDGKFVYILADEEGKYRLFQADKGIAQEMAVQDWQTENFYTEMEASSPDSVKRLPNGNVVVTFDGLTRWTLVYDGKTGEQKDRIEMDGAIPVYCGEDEYATIRFSQQKQTDELALVHYGEKDPFQQMAIDYNALYPHFLAKGPQNTYLAASPEKVQSLDGQSGSVVMEGTRYSFGNPAYDMVDFQYEPAGEMGFMVLTDYNNGLDRLFQYKMASVQPGEQGELTIFTLRDSFTLRQAVADFQVKNPQTDIRLEIALGEDSAATKEDIIRVLNTELLAKKGPDVLILDGLPVKTYLRQGVLLDISDIAASEENFVNITGALNIGGKVCAIPTRAIVPLAAGSRELIDQMTDYPAIAKKAAESPDTVLDATVTLPFEQRPLLHISNYRDLLLVFYNIYADDLIDENNRINQQKLEEFLSCSKTLYDKYDKKTAKGGTDVPLPERAVLSFSPQSVYEKQTQLGIKLSSGFSDFTDWCDAGYWEDAQGNPQYPSLYMKPLCAPSANVFIPMNIAGVNISSKQPDLAKAFVQGMISPQVQANDYQEGFPVNRAAFQAGLDKTKKLFASYETDVEHLYGSLKTPVIRNDTLLEAVAYEAALYFDDRETIDDATANIIKKMQTYLAEKS